MSKMDAGSLGPQKLDGGFDQNRAQAIACDQRPASLAARQQGLPNHRPGQAGGSIRRIDVQGRQQQWLHQPLV